MVGGSQHSRLPDTGDPRSKPRLSPQPTLGLGLELHCCIDFSLFRGIMQTCPASMAYDNQKIRDVVDDAVELDVATKMVVGEG